MSDGTSAARKMRKKKEKEKTPHDDDGACAERDAALRGLSYHQERPNYCYCCCNE